MPQVLDIRFAAMLDFQFEPGKPPKELVENFAAQGDDVDLEDLRDDYETGEGWLWYHVLRSNRTLFGQRERMFWSIPSSDDSTAVGQFMYLPQRGVGVATVWASDPAWHSNPMQAKHSPWGDVSQWAGILGRANLANPAGDFLAERIYTLLIVQVAEDDLTSFCLDNADAVAAWFTGGLERESFERKRKLVGPAGNISKRSYERIFMRWTDSLALYNSSIDDDDYRVASCRAAQLFEHCILARRIFRTDGQRIARLTSSTRFFISFPRTFMQANRALSSFTSAEYELVISPPVGFVEAEELVRKAIKRCGVPRFIRDTRQSYGLLDSRLQLARGQWLAIVAFGAFLANAVIAVWVALIHK